MFALLALAFIVVSGAAVRLTGSGLGCSDWPTCEQDRLVAPLSFHPMVEFTNRLVTFVVSAAVILAVVGAFKRRPYRRDLLYLSWGLVAGVVAQVVLGGVTVLFELWPPLVMGHFLLSMILLANAVVLVHRAGRGPVRKEWTVDRELVLMTRLVLVAGSMAVFLGTVVTGSGPHGGDEEVDRLPFLVPDVVRLHAISVIVLVIGVIITWWLARRTNAGELITHHIRVTLGLLLAQAAIGYIQYFNSVPALLVGIHVFGAVLVWCALVRLAVLPRGHDPLESPPEHAPSTDADLVGTGRG